MTRGHYKTKQQLAILSCLKNCEGFVTVDALYEQLMMAEIKVGRATVYRFLERLCEEKLAVKCKASDSAHTEYRYIADNLHDHAQEHTEDDSTGKLCCVSCGKVFPLHCMQLEGFSRHVLSEHGFILQAEKTVLYGKCSHCAGIGIQEAKR